MSPLSFDTRTVLTLDAGGTSFRFSAMQGGRLLFDPLRTPSHGADLDRCLETLRDGFAAVAARLPSPASAISFAFPGPADYPRGIIGDLPNLPAFRGGVALGPMLEAACGLPVFINNDGDLFAYGEALGGLLPEVNARLAGGGSPKRFRNLVGVTLGTGFGGGFATGGELFAGDNSAAAEVWLMRNHLRPEMHFEESLSIRAVRRTYAERAGVPLDSAPDPRAIQEIAEARAPGDRAAAVAAYTSLGEALGEALCDVLAFTDGLAVVGGGLSAAYPLFAPAALAVFRSEFAGPDGVRRRRLCQRVFDLEDSAELDAFVRGDARTIPVPGTGRTVAYDPLARLGLGRSRLGTSEAIGLGAYAFALARLDRPR